MQVKLALLADYANLTAEGKLNILGIFDRVQVTQLPAVHPQMQFVIRLEARPAEKDRPHTLELRLQDPDGETVFDIQGEMVPRGGGATQTVATNQIITINNLAFAKTGGYTFAVFVDGDLRAEVPLAVEEGFHGARPSDGFQA
jgi:hypothetical protein